jgi:hypothetical protein
MAIHPSEIVRLKGGTSGERVTASGSVFNARELKLKTTLKAGLIKAFQ